ncbi:hypothetical protein CVT25_004889 [Psilocybe cyanescens]|uniref:RNA helicase n=1 Tax=Psilocybe cyanescens TaxID=93625 RepID=A0A409XBN1_PSICY|nr:hypothetical protein CVT25_004889 [Psilocybe cyanescens]
MLRTPNVFTHRLSFMQCIRPDEWLGTRICTFRRHRSGTAVRHRPKARATDLSHPEHQELQKSLRGIESLKKPWETERRPEYRGIDLSRKSHPPMTPKPVDIPVIAETEVLAYFQENIDSWASSQRTQHRLALFGIPGQDSRKLLHTFVNDVEAGRLSDPLNYNYYGLQRFSHKHDRTSIDVIYNTIFFLWASNPENQARLEKHLGVHPKTTDLISQLLEATNRQFPGDEFPNARAIQRKFIMHVGPTNSGKTHHALRALAAAKSGVYAGPLRLLAHEIWNRLNTGQIVPLGVDVDPNDKSGYSGKPEYVKPCNMVTGEEQKLVEGARLLSCTIEMLSFRSHYDVAVIDEIQMIGDESRGGGWTNAVLGLVAKEIHLCGEETAIPIVQDLLRYTGDEIVIRRYERLTPLVVEDKSLDSNVHGVRKGDCIVTFSRRNIFDLKKTVESNTGLKCAVVYGRLPPEVRSEQAALFNDPNSGYDVIIGSDAIGMGLNLKIKRVIFQAMQKFEGGSMAPLPVSSVKQIAGRAGRYGLHQSKVDLGGTTTTLFESDLKRLRGTLPMPYKPLSFARIGTTSQVIGKTLSILPPGTTMHTAVGAAQYIGRLPYFMRYMEFDKIDAVCQFLDSEWHDMSNDDKVMVMYAPIPWRDEKTTTVIKRVLHIHRRDFTVKLEDITRGEVYMETMENIERMMEKQVAKGEAKPVKGKAARAKYMSTLNSLVTLEAFHKLLVFYTWMSFRNSVVYSDMSIAPIKERLEKVLNWSLVDMSRDVTAPMLKPTIREIEPSTNMAAQDVPPTLIIPEMLNDTPLEQTV